MNLVTGLLEAIVESDNFRLKRAEDLLRNALDLASHAAHDGRKGPRANAARNLRDSIRDFLAESDRLRATDREPAV